MRRNVAHAMVLACALCTGSVATNAPARDGDVMAPGAARIVSFDAAGTLRVRILEQEYAGRWERITPDKLRLLPQHWRGRRAELRTWPLVRADLSGSGSAVLACELALVEDRPAGVCEDASRTYYLQP